MANQTDKTDVIAPTFNFGLILCATPIAASLKAPVLQAPFRFTNELGCLGFERAFDEGRVECHQN